jgi:anti-sigma-K factor RskA
MNRNDPDTLDLLAAEFVLGTLGGAARRRFDRARQADPFVERRVLAWEERLAGLTFRLDPVTPSPAVWPSIERRIGAAPARRRGGLMAAAAAVAAAAALGLGWFLWPMTISTKASTNATIESLLRAKRRAASPQSVRSRRWASGEAL